MSRKPLDLDTLIAELFSTEALRRETAVARLALAGAPAVPRLLAIAADPAAVTDARAAAFAALEASSDARSVVSAAGAAVEDASDDVALAAIGVLAHAARGQSPSATIAFDRLAATALDPAATVPRRLDALAGLEGLPERHVRPVYEALGRDSASRVVARVLRRQAGLALPLEEMARRRLPDSPALVAAVVREESGEAPLAALRRLVDAIAAQERQAAEPARGEWRAVRGQVHQHLAARGSRIALYDLRDTLKAMRAPLPVGFLSAAAAIGDAPCLEAIARAWVEAPAQEGWWRGHLAEAFGAIVRREGLTRSHPRVRAVLQRWPSAGPLVALARKR